MCGLVPFLQVMAGFGAPLVWQVNKAVLPSVTVWSDGGDANVGATPEKQRQHDKNDDKEKAAEHRMVMKKGEARNLMAKRMEKERMTVLI